MMNVIWMNSYYHGTLFGSGANEDYDIKLGLEEQEDEHDSDEQLLWTLFGPDAKTATHSST